MFFSINILLFKLFIRLRSIGADILKGQPEGRFGLESLKEGYVEPLQSVFLPVPVLAMMLTLPGRFPKSFFPFDSVTFANHPSISLISRETSKPQRCVLNYHMVIIFSSLISCSEIGMILKSVG